ncbi:NADH dehydrogenase (ubiquinone) complex I, assembly factor 6 [Mycoemilia scoparia]|uniref:NADH dehydrogenase (Ubiquinone) complex I, assembly factor 6 n=1 Tax=Mycoemilia scoparia TaxID=417184 RepID=A0A9W8A3Y7_9FUNG|nr:NADH dehydrogenase (ubiquinone) complex I, assembly factor 6 [Mycoemilia scoparia]
MSGWKKLPGRLFSQNRDTVVDISRLTIKTFSTTSILPQGGGLGSKSPSKIEIPKGSIITRKSDMAYCQELVRKGDHDNYLCSLFSPQPVRELVWTIRALNLELSRIGDVVSQEAVGRMRYEFWKNAIDGAFKGQPPQLPVARALADVHSRFRLSKMWIRRLLKTREEYFLKSKFDTIKDLEQYGENTVASLIHLQLEALGVRDMQADQAARTIGQASAIATFLRSFPQLTTSKDNCFLPQELINKVRDKPNPNPPP